MLGLCRARQQTAHRIEKKAFHRFIKFKKKLIIMNKFNINIPYGTCHCGCGKKTNISKRSIKSRGIKEGEPCKYVTGHDSKKRLSNKIKFTVDIKTGCWNWTGNFRAGGYGYISIRGKKYNAHALIYKIYQKVIRENEELDHICNNPGCVNPNHLRSVTHKFNVRRGKTVKLNMDTANKIREDYKSGYKMRALSKKYKICLSNISDIINNKIWT